MCDGDHMSGRPEEVRSRVPRMSDSDMRHPLLSRERR